jgi:hypothetical protein
MLTDPTHNDGNRTISKWQISAVEAIQSLTTPERTYFHEQDEGYTFLGVRTSILNSEEGTRYAY